MNQSWDSATFKDRSKALLLLRERMEEAGQRADDLAVADVFGETVEQRKNQLEREGSTAAAGKEVLRTYIAVSDDFGARLAALFHEHLRDRHCLAHNHRIVFH